MFSIELTQRQREMMQDPKYRDQLFFEAELIPEEIEEMYYQEQEQQEAERRRSPVDEFGLPPLVDVRRIPVKVQEVVFPKFQP